MYVRRCIRAAAAAAAIAALGGAASDCVSVAEADCCELFDELGDPGFGFTCSDWSCLHQFLGEQSYFRPVRGLESGFDAVLPGVSRGWCRYQLAIGCGPSYEDPCIYGAEMVYSCTNWIPDLSPPFGLCP
ncbi:MAG TPA: hypothetical protein PKC43_12110 [Phycisphaerales bacterium]|nr:hypothetical protein [Phycisphaerales bacterium]HMP38176.1 hypothetical protein [Phycisphaerales bacterium]